MSASYSHREHERNEGWGFVADMHQCVECFVVSHNEALGSEKA